MLIIILLCFGVGALSVYLNISNRITLFPQPTPSATTAVTNQKTALILGVDDLENPQPRLLSVWFATFRFPDNEIILYGLPTDHKTDLSLPSFADMFHWSPEKGVDSALLDALQRVYAPKPNVILILDELGFSALIDFLEGVTLEGTPMDGETVVNALRFFYEDPSQSLKVQTKILRALVQQVDVLEPPLDLTVLFNLIPVHAHCSEPPSLVAAKFGLLLPFRQDAIFIAHWPQKPEEQLSSFP